MALIHTRFRITDIDHSVAHRVALLEQ